MLAATELAAAADGAAAAGAGEELGGEAYSDVESYSSDEEEGSSYGGSGAGGGGGAGGRPPARPGSIASTYWRDERTDRKNLLTVIDEKCVVGWGACVDVGWGGHGRGRGGHAVSAAAPLVPRHPLPARLHGESALPLPPPPPQV